nr:TonB-dependent siderophore receptor [Rhizomicrobium palustre]
MTATSMIALLAAADVDGGAVAPLPASSIDTSARELVTVKGERQSGYLPTTSSSAKIDAPLRDIPQSIAVISEDVLRDQRALSIQDAVKNVPGVGLSSGDGQRDQVFIRGFTAIGDQYVDGFRDDGLYFRDLSNVETLEVVKGPAAVLYGRGSSGGIINRVTKKPDRDITAFTVTGGSFDDKRGEIDLGRSDLGYGVGFRVTGAWEDSDSFRDQQFLHRVAISPSLMLGRGSDTTLLLQADYLRDRRLTDFGIPAINGRPVDVPRNRYYGAANAKQADVSQAEVLSQTAVVEHRFSDSLSLRNGFRHYNYSLNRHNTNSTAVNTAAQTVSLSHGGVLRDEDGWSNQLELTQKLELLGTHHSLLYGWEQSNQGKDAVTLKSTVVAVTNIFNPVLPVIDNANFTAASASNTNRFTTTGLYVQDLVDIGYGIKAMVGVRHDDFHQKTTQRIAGQPNLARTDSNWSPRAGLVYQPDTMQSYYLSWSRSYQPSGETFALAATNADLAPEKTENKEFGAKYSLLDNRLSIQAAAYDLRRTNIKGTDPITQKVIPVGVQRTQGVEISAALDLPNDFRAMLGYSYMDGKVTQSATPSFVGKRATLTPEHSFNAFLTKTLFTDYGIGAGLNYVGDRWADPANTTILPSYVTMDAMGWADFGVMRLQVNLYNLTNEGYIVSGHGTSALLNVPGAPRSVLVTARVKL